MTRQLLPIILIFLFFSCSNNSDDNQSPNSNENAALEVTNTVEVTTNENNFLGVDDVLTYTVLVKNTGEVDLTNINLTYTLTDNNGNPLTLNSAIAFVNSDLGSSNGSLLTNETATYTATYTITQSDVDAGGVSNSISAEALTPDGNTITDISDDGIDDDGNLIDDSTITILTEPTVDSTIISQFHVLNSDGDPYIKYYFDYYGQLYKIYYTDIRTHPHNIFIYNFEFDSEQKLINYSKNNENGVPLWSSDIIYDAQYRIMSIGSRQFEFVDEDSDYYIDLDNYSEEIWTNGDIEYTEIYFTKYSVGSNPIMSVCSYSYSSEYNTITEEFSEYGGCGDTWWNNYNGNVTSDCSDTDCVIFSHNTITNPLYSTTNLINLYPLVSPFGGNYNLLFFLFSQNNLTLINYSDPSRIAFTYILNENNLPESSTRQYIDELGPQPAQAFGNYYYQGDAIPD
ncbi:DUF7507 domain-containing protein [Xanthomarina spongicola]|uniref:Putative repeat protein (TIGR01451 family) n=1 Tax=Xanthomarina spongicola TaxID=570520 RepID=A0A316DSV7_9FLAO|nr:hypothetical protein [Xanthomarina spongicola]PWK21075.1 putative repeat protein (TIGR01451 family) [Xanthomarina spongicola]